MCGCGSVGECKGLWCRDASGLAHSGPAPFQPSNQPTWLEPDKTSPDDHTLSARRDAIPLVLGQTAKLQPALPGIDMPCGS